MSHDDADVCIIGCGPAGAVLGAHLVEHGVRVVVLEAGPRHPFADRAAHQRAFLGGVDPWERTPASLDVASSGGPVPYDLRGLRVRAVGGSTLHWGAETPRFQAADFRLHHTHGVGTDWPFGYETLEPYYGRAELELGVAGDEDPFASPRSTPYPLPALPINHLHRLVMRAAEPLGLHFSPIPQARNSRPYRGRSRCLGCGTCHVCPTGAKASADLTHVLVIDASPYGRIVENATVLRLETGRDGRVRQAVWAGLDRVEHAASASLFVLAGGGVECARLLLLSRSAAFPDGLANRSGVVGCGFRDHPLFVSRGRVSEPVPTHRISFYSATCNRYWDTPERSRRSGFTLYVSPHAGASPAALAVTTPLWGDALAAHVRREFGSVLQVESPVEMLPDDRNAVDLDPTLRDYFGLPAPRISVRLGEYEETGRHAALATQTELLAAFGARDIEHEEHVYFQAHHSGTCRMGGDAATSVVSPDLRSHDVPNLFVAGSATFPTSGLANPTLTIVALSLRLADHLLAARGAGRLP